MQCLVDEPEWLYSGHLDMDCWIPVQLVREERLTTMTCVNYYCSPLAVDPGILTVPVGS